MKVGECAFPQPIAPSGYELNTENSGLNKHEWLAYQLFVKWYDPLAKQDDIRQLARSCAKDAKIMISEITK